MAESFSARARSALVATAVAAASVLGACAPDIDAPGWRDVFLTRVGLDTYRVHGSAEELTYVASGGNRPEANTRSILYRDDVARARDQAVCETAVHPGGIHQDGVALRVNVDGQRFRAITVTRNIYGWVTTRYNVHVWDSAFGGELPAILLSSTDLHAAIGPAGNAPRRLCARVDGDVLTLKVWPANAPEPDWDDPVHTARTVLPRGWTYEGVPGVYLGHIPPGSSARLFGIDVEPLAETPDDGADPAAED